jgi:hypothetical protein
VVSQAGDRVREEHHEAGGIEMQSKATVYADHEEERFLALVEHELELLETQSPDACALCGEPVTASDNFVRWHAFLIHLGCAVSGAGRAEPREPVLTLE